MSDTPPELQRTRFLLTSLVIIAIFILTLVFLVAAYPDVLAPEPTRLPTITPTRRPTFTPTATVPTATITPTPTITRTPRPTLTPTITPSPTHTSTPEPTLTMTGPPTLTPARPLLGSENYSLGAWTPQNASAIIERMEYYPNTLTSKERGADNAAYFAAYKFAVVALQEALVRFPDASEADAWRWDLAYNLARVGDPHTGQSYADLIVEGLNQSQVDFNDLSNWFKSKEPRLDLDIVALTPLSGYISANLLVLHGPGSTFIWLYQTSSAYSAEVLTSQFDFVRSPEMYAILSNLTGEQNRDEELVIYTVTPDTDLHMIAPDVFSLAQIPAQRLDFQPSQAEFEIGTDFRNYWAVTKTDSGGNDLLFKATIFQACPLTIERQYHWDGKRFILVRQSYQIEPSTDSLFYCKQVVEHAHNVWGPQVSADLMVAVLPDWPPAQDDHGNPLPADARDEWRYRLGIEYALSGDFTGATGVLNEVVQSPIVGDSRWVEPAKTFLQNYQKPEDLYRACSSVAECNPDDAIGQILNALPADQFPNAIDVLWKAGASLRVSGYFDFDGDQQSERWFMVRPRPLERLTFWIVAAGPEQLYAFPIIKLDNASPTLTIFDEHQVPPIVWIDGEIAITLDRDQDTRQPFIHTASVSYQFPNRFELGLLAAEQALWDGEDPALVRQTLLNLETNPGLLCAPYYTCDTYYYFLGLANELAGNNLDAIEAYLQVWWDNSLSPYTTIVRLRLTGGAVLPSTTPTPTESATPGPSETPTVTGTPPTETPTPTETSPPTETTTPTETPTPTETQSSSAA